MLRTKLSDTVDVIKNEGFFQVLKTKHPELAWIDDAKRLDINYYYGHSGEKYISAMYDKLIKDNPDTALDTVVDIIYDTYGANWSNIYNALTMDYNPLENYNSEEVENVGSKVTSTTSNQGAVYGFNSSAAVPANEGKATATTEGNKADNERSLHRHGNIGVTTSQQMLNSEIELRQYKFINQVMNDVDKMLCLMCY